MTISQIQFSNHQMGEVDFQKLPRDLLLPILLQDTSFTKDVILIGKNTLNFRLVCKEWKHLIDEQTLIKLFHYFTANCHRLNQITNVFNLRSMIATSIDEMNQHSHIRRGIHLEKFLQLNQQIKRLIGPRAGSSNALISSISRIQQLTRSQHTNLHILYRTLKQQVHTMPDLKTIEEISQWMKAHQVDLEQVQDLTLNGGQLTALPVEIKYLSQLEILELPNNQLQELPEEIGKLAHLEMLNLSGNRFKIFPKVIGELHHLRILDLRGNHLTNVPKEIGNLKELEEVDLSHNKISQLPAEIGNLKELEELDLSHNWIRQLPAEIGNLDNLERLDVSYNQIIQFPLEMRNLNELSVFDFYPNYPQT